MHPISGEIEAELALVAHEAGRLATALDRIDQGNPRDAGSQESWEASILCASAAESIYTGCERVMAKIAADVDGEKVDKTIGWHIALLARMNKPFKTRQAILTEPTYILLERMRAFRHFKRNSYGSNLDSEIVLQRAREAIRAYDKFAIDVRHFLADQPGHPPGL